MLSVQGEKGKFHLKMTAEWNLFFFFFLPGFGTFDEGELERVDRGSFIVIVLL